MHWARRAQVVKLIYWRRGLSLCQSLLLGADILRVLVWEGELPVTVTLSESHPQSPRVRGGAPGLGLGAIWLAPLPTRSHRSPAEPGVVTLLASDWLLGPVPGLWLVGRPLVTRPSLRESLLAAPVTLLHPATFIYIKNIFNSSNKLNSKVALICICPLLG